MTEVLKDRSLALPPLNRLLARRLMEETKVFRFLQGYRNFPAADITRIEEALIRLAQLITDSLAANVPRVIVGGNIQLGIDSPPEQLLVRVGPLRDGGAGRIMDASALGDLPPVLERLTKEHRIEGSPDGEILTLILVNPH